MRARVMTALHHTKITTLPIFFDVHMIWKIDIFGKIRFRRK